MPFLLLLTNFAANFSCASFIIMFVREVRLCMLWSNLMAASKLAEQIYGTSEKNVELLELLFILYVCSRDTQQSKSFGYKILE